MKARDPELKANWGTICTLLPLKSADGKMHKENVTDTKGLFRLIQSIPSPKAEPFKLWIAEVAKQRLDQMQDPELSIEQAIIDYRRLGYSENWINQRIRSIEVRKALTDEWRRGGMEHTSCRPMSRKMLSPKKCVKISKKRQISDHFYRLFIWINNPRYLNLRANHKIQMP